MNTPASVPASVLYKVLQRSIHFSTFAVLIGSAVTLFASVWWAADLIANLRIQMLIALGVVWMACLLLRSWRLAVICAITIAWHASWLSPREKAGRAADGVPAAGQVLKVCSVNVLTSNRQHDRIIAGLRTYNADIIAVLELSTELTDRLTEDMGDDYPHRVMEPDDGGNFGIGLLSRFPLQNVRIFELTSLPLPSISADVEWNGRTVHIMATHPIPPMSRGYFEARNHHLQSLGKLATEQRTDRPTVPIIVVGDLNVTPWSPHFRNFQQASGLEESCAGPWFVRLQPTWYRWSAFPFGLVLDHAFSTPDLICTKRLVGLDTGSDHRPVYVEYAVTAEKGSR